MPGSLIGLRVSTAYIHVLCLIIYYVEKVNVDIDGRAKSLTGTMRGRQFIE